MVVPSDVVPSPSGAHYHSPPGVMNVLCRADINDILVYADAHGTGNRLSLRKSRGKNNHASWLTIEDETEEVEISWTKRSKRDTKR